jgi:tRNA A-37 threonylcarbamoyl transferase component Bud32
MVVAGGGRLYRKHHRGGAAVLEWRTLQELSARGFRVPRTLFVARGAGISVVGLAAVSGRAMDLLLAQAAAERRTAEFASYALERVAPLIARLHAAGFVYRDLYWNHLFAAPDDEPILIDVHRAKRPR